MSDLISKQAAVEAIASEARRIREDIVHHAETDYLVGLHRAELIVSKLEPETQPAPTVPDLLPQIAEQFQAYKAAMRTLAASHRTVAERKAAIAVRDDFEGGIEGHIGTLLDAIDRLKALSASSPVVPRSGMCEDGNTHFCHGCGKNLVGSSPLPPARDEFIHTLAFKLCNDVDLRLMEPFKRILKRELEGETRWQPMATTRCTCRIENGPFKNETLIRECPVHREDKPAVPAGDKP